MHLTVWTKTPEPKVLTALAVVLPPDLPLLVTDSLEKAPTESVVLGLGKEARDVLESLKVIPKNRKITSLRSHVYAVGGRIIMLSYSPGIHEVDYGLYVDLLCDAKKAVRMALTGTHEPKLGHYEYVDDFSQLIAEIEAEYEKTKTPVDVSHDTETLGLDPLAQWTPDRPAARFITWQFSHKPGYSAVRYFHSKEEFDELLVHTPLGEQIRFLLTSPKVSLKCANGKYDLTWHWFHTKIECTNFKFDTTLVGSLLDENRSNALDVHAKIYTPIGGYSDVFDQTYDKSRMDLVPKGPLLTYAGGDTDAGLRVALAERAELLKNKRLTAFYVNILHPAARAFEVIERGGIFIDMEEYKRLEADLLAAIEGQVKEAIPIIGGRIRAKHRDLSKPGGLNLTKAGLLVDFMFSPMGLNLKPVDLTLKDKSPSTAIDHLLKFKDHPKAGPFVKLIEEYSSATKVLNTYVTGFKKHIRTDGRFHPSYFLHRGNRDEGEGGTVTGRSSAKDPAFQTVPKLGKWAKRIRKVFCAPPGFLVGELDYAQGELRVVACIANEQTMLSAFQENKDIHVLTGADIVDLTYEQVMELEKTNPSRFEEIRYYAKPANFGLLYGQFPQGFKDYADSNYGISLTLERATEIRDKFFKKYPGLVEYHSTYKAYAREHGYVVSPLGRVRHLPLIKSYDKWKRLEQERRAINSPVQSTLSDLMLMALGMEWKAGIMREAPCFGMVHDASYSYLPEDRAVEFILAKKTIMENLPLDKVGWKPQLKFLADGKVGKSMGELTKVKE